MVIIKGCVQWNPAAIENISAAGSDQRTKYQRRKKLKIANSFDLDEVAHNEPPHLDLHCLSSSL